jgi:hypothetical protein
MVATHSHSYTQHTHTTHCLRYRRVVHSRIHTRHTYKVAALSLCFSLPTDENTLGGSREEESRKRRAMPSSSINFLQSNRCWCWDRNYNALLTSANSHPTPVGQHCLAIITSNYYFLYSPSDDNKVDWIELI